jgi:hypothetical protein
MQGDRQMSAYDRVFDRMADSRESAILSAAAEAVAWKHASELEDGARKGQRVVMYPKELSQLETVLSTGDPNVGSEDGHPIAYSAILQAAQSYERPPLFLREDHDLITSDPEKAEKIPEWMNTAAKVATRNRRRVLEDGPDVMNSDEEDALKEEHGDELEGMYTAGMDLEKGPVKLTHAQVAAQKAAAKAIPRSQTPVSGSSDDDHPNGSEYVWSQTKGCMRKNKHHRKAATDASKTIVLRRECTEETGSEGGGFPKSACSSETSTRGKSLKTSERTGESRGKGLKTNGNTWKSSEQSWRLAIGGRFRANGYVCCKWQPSQNLSRNLFPRRRFSPTGDSAAFNGTARQPSPALGTRLHPPHPYSGPPGRCPVQPGTPLGPDQVNVLLL